jgi:hypothetical protein
MKKIALFVLVSLLTAISSRADVLYQDTFSYSNGPAADVSTNVVAGILVTNWITHSGSDDDFIKNHRLEVSTSTAYLGVTATRSGDIHRFFTNSPAYTGVQQVLYASFIVNFTNLPTAAGAYFAHFYFSSSTFPCRIWAQTNGSVLPNTFRLGVDVGSTAPPNKIYPVDLALNTDYQVVIGYCPITGDPGGLTDDSVTMWINPVSFSDAPVTTTESFVPGTTIANAFAFRQASGFGGFLTVTNLVIATTFAEAFTNGVVTTNAMAPSIVYQPAASSVTNFVGASVRLSAVADGQGLGSMLYQWQIAATTNSLGQPVSPANITNPNGNTNILTIDNGNAQISDTGYYTLVATTPYGLSVTSAVAHVVISAAPVPPTFTVEPVTQTLYTGQNMLLSTTVTSPGNVSYTWYSNSIPISSTQSPLPNEVDSGDTSTFESDNLTPANSATYKVAVTNDVVVNGVVSTNAVVTVLNAPTVTIAFLRSLVDPNNNYQPTNLTQPFQVSGVITTYTNITSGNTASYYLQDGTAGINIFATFGSTFRPAEGDIVTYVGVLSSFSSGLELFADTTDRPYTSYTDLGAGTLPSPMIIPFTITNTGYANMNTNIGGRFVQLTNVFFGTNAGTTVSSGFMTVTNGLGQSFNLWFSAQDLDTVGQTVPDYAISVTGVMFGSMNPSLPVGGVPSPNFAVAVTKWSDIVVPLPAPPTLAYVQSGNTLTFSWSAAGYNLQSQTNALTVGLQTNNTSWFDYPDTSNPVNITVDPANPTVFYRLNHP